MSVEAKNAKQLIIDEIKAKFDKSISIVVVDYLGITVAQADELRKTLRENGNLYSFILKINFYKIL